MIIQIDVEHRIVNKDGLNWDVEKLIVSPETVKGKPNPRAGEEKWKCQAHCPSLKHACLRVLSMHITRETTDNVADIIAAIRRAEYSIILAVDGGTKKARPCYRSCL